MSAVDFSKETVIIIVAFTDGVNENDPASIRSDCPADSRHNGLIRLCVEKASSKKLDKKMVLFLRALSLLFLNSYATIEVGNL